MESLQENQTVLLALVDLYDFELEQLDVKTTFLHGELEERIYMKNQRDLYFLERKTIEFEMKDLGAAKKILGMEICRNRVAGIFFLSQKGYIEKKAVLQSAIALLTTEVEYMAMAEAVKESIWLKGLIGDFSIDIEKSVMYSDSQSPICLTKNQVYHERIKHIDVRYQFIQEVVSQGVVEIEKVETVETVDNLATC
ncbi:hypothetical protein CRG98_035791 [Punica granatum]|uniref:Reverse transcriptase Ty1/copia-type domain-containing protein n=1 Tax=Punica granatum TaxID=22663 RepID=A0A2I0IJA6_PUNGR|nr:hypothetical protein CRG98_035791 [Punica granatum]